jgi:predicted metal-dependent phosphoesterase TrpH
VTVSASGLRLDLHNHTRVSADGLLTPAALLQIAKARGIGCLAVTDHNAVRGALDALALAAADPSLPRVIPGTEVSTEAGEIIGLYLTEDIPRGLPLAETVRRIRDRGGLVYLPHPYDVFRRGAVDRTERTTAAELADMVEVMNGRALGPRSGTKSARLARALGKPGGAGSDAHREREVGRAYVVVEEQPTRDTLVALVAAGRVEHRLRLIDYALDWGSQASAPVTRIRRKMTGDLAGGATGGA